MTFGNRSRSNETWLAAPESFNDPYDSAFSIRVTSQANDLFKSHLSESLRLTGIDRDLSPEQIQSVGASEDPIGNLYDLLMERDAKVPGEARPGLKEALRVVREKRDAEMASEMVEAVRDSVRICCFSEVPDSILMWSHYADYHRGFCLEFETEKLIKYDMGFRMLHPVVYRQELPDVTEEFLDKGNTYMPIVSACTKSEDWAYEREWRFVVAFRALNHKPVVSLGAPSRIILGSKVLEKHRNKIEEVAALRKIPVVASRRSADSFKLEIPDGESMR